MDSAATGRLSLLGRGCRWSLVVVAISLPAVLWGAVRALQIEIDDTSAWFGAGHAAKADYDRFTRDFENGDLLVISWTGCEVGDPRLDEFVRDLRESPQFQSEAGQRYFDRVTCGADFYRSLRDAPLELTHEEAVQRLRGSVLGADGKSTCAVVTFSKAGVADRAQAVQRVRRALGACGIAEPERRLAGPIMDGYEVHLATNQSLDIFGPLSAIVVLFSCRLCLRSWSVAGIVFALSFYCQALALACVHFSGQQMSPLMIVMPPLILVLGVSGGIHLVNYHYDALDRGDPSTAAIRAFRIGWLPCVLSIGTTAIGMMSLIVSDLQPIRLFGLFSAIGVLITLGLLFLIIPGAFEMWHPQLMPAAEPQGAQRRRTLLRAIGSWLGRHHGIVTAGSVAAMLIPGYFISRLTTSVRIETLFSAQARILQDYRWLEHHIGPLVPIEVLLRFPAGCTLNDYERLQLVAETQRALVKLDQVSGALSAATLLPDTITRRTRSIALRVVANKRLGKARPQLIQAGFLHDGPDVQQWRLNVRVSALDDLDYGDFLRVVRAQVEPVLLKRAAGGGNDPTCLVTGAMPLVHDLQHELFRDLFASFLSALVLITVVMMFSQRGILAGLVAMVPNVFPIVLLFGLLAWARIPLDIGSVMTASIALGIAIDGTLHFLTFFRRGLDAGATRIEAVQSAYEHCARAMTESSAICAVGLATFAFSKFLPTQRFAALMVGLIAAAWVGDLVVLPSLLAGPCGHCFRRTRPIRPT